MDSDSSQISWYFDLYYMSYIAAKGNVKETNINKSFKHDMVNLIQNQDMNLTIKCMAVNIMENYGVWDSDSINEINKLIINMDDSFYMKNGQYSLPVYPTGNISTTYYVYLYKKSQGNNDKDVLLKSGLEELLKAGGFENYSFQELYQLSYLFMEYSIISEKEIGFITNFCLESIHDQISLSEVYFVLATIEVLNENVKVLEQNHVEIISGLVNEQLKLSNIDNIEVYDKMFGLFLCSNINKIFESNDLYNISVDYEQYMKGLKEYLGEDIRLLYFYFAINKNINHEFYLEDQLVNKYKNKGIYKLNQDSSVKSMFIQYIGEMMDSYNHESLPDWPII